MRGGYIPDNSLLAWPLTGFNVVEESNGTINKRTQHKVLLLTVQK